jgi:hypothetical protein
MKENLEKQLENISNAYRYIIAELSEADLLMNEDEAMQITAFAAAMAEYMNPLDTRNKKFFVACVRARLKLRLDKEYVGEGEIDQKEAFRFVSLLSQTTKYLSQVRDFLKQYNFDPNCIANAQGWVRPLVEKYEIVFDNPAEKKCKDYELRDKYIHIALKINNAVKWGHSIIAKWFDESNAKKTNFETRISSALIEEQNDGWHLIGLTGAGEKHCIGNARIIRYADGFPVELIYDGSNFKIGD